MSDIQFRMALRQALSTGDQGDMETAIRYGVRLGMSSWELLDSGIPLEFLAEDVAALDPPLRVDTYRASDLIALGVPIEGKLAGYGEYLPAKYGKYPTLEMCATREEYWKKAKEYTLLQDGTLISPWWGDTDPGSRARDMIVTDPQIRTAFDTLSRQTDLIKEARRLVVAEAAGNNPILAEILAWNMEYNNGILDEPQTIVVDGKEVLFWSVGRNSSCNFGAGLYGLQRYQYSFCEEEAEPTIRMVDNWRGYYGHF